MVLTREGSYVADMLPHSMSNTSLMSSVGVSRSLPNLRSGRSTVGGRGSLPSAKGKRYTKAPTREEREMRRSSRSSHGRMPAASQGASHTKPSMRPCTSDSAQPVRRLGVPNVPRKIKRGIRQPPSFEGRDNWVKHPMHATRSAMMALRRATNLPHSSFDVDGDGVISQEDFYLANKFDVNQDGELQADEQHELRKKMVKDTVQLYRELPHPPNAKTSEELIKAFTTDLEHTVDHPDFRKSYNKLQNKTACSKTYDSKQLHRALQPYPRLGAPLPSAKGADISMRPLFTPKGTPTFALDSYRPVTHRLSLDPRMGVTRGKLLAKRKRESNAFATGMLASSRQNSVLRPVTGQQGAATGVGAACRGTNPRWSIAPHGKPVGSHHVGINRHAPSIEAHGGHNEVHGGHFRESHTHWGAPAHAAESHPHMRSQRIVGRGSHITLVGDGWTADPVRSEVEDSAPLPYQYHGLLERHPDTGMKIR